MNKKQIVLIFAVVFCVVSAGISIGDNVDVNGDGVVNTADLKYVDKHIGKTGNHAADVNGDKVVNVFDLVLVKRAIGTRTPPPPPPPSSGVDGMVLIPAGEFEMGDSIGDGWNRERPVHTVYVDAFYMDTYEVTNAEYAAFLNAKGKHTEAGRTWFDINSSDARIDLVGGTYRTEAGYEDHPVVDVSWYGAMAYAQWAGKRLPTEAEWEKAARGGLAGKRYPSGDTIDATKANYDRNIGDTTPVGQYAPNGYGLYGMAGNVREWCLDAYDSGFYRNSPRRNPIAGANNIGEMLNKFSNNNLTNVPRVLRGGSRFSGGFFVRVAFRGFYTPTFTDSTDGFRCARAR